MSDRILRNLSALSVIALAAGIGCSSGADPAPSSTPEFQSPVAQEPTAAAPVTPQTLTIQASTPEMEKIAQELARGLAHDDQPVGQPGELLEDPALLLVGLPQHGVERGHDRHANVLDQRQQVCAGRAAEDPVFVLE